MGILNWLRRSSAAGRIGEPALFLVVVAASLALGLSIPDDRGALLGALVASAIGSALILLARLRFSSGRSAKRPATATALTEEATQSQVHSRPYLVPRELPPAPPGFVGRTEEVDRLLQVAARTHDGSPYIAAIYGAPGIGKSALAVYAAHKMAPSFPDGQIFVQMREAKLGPDSVRELIEHFVIALKGPADPLPPTPEELRAEYAALTQRYSVLFVIDDAAPAIDIASILPNGSKCAIIITCRTEPDWPDVNYERIPLDPLTAPDAVSMLRKAAGADWPGSEVSSFGFASPYGNEDEPYLKLANRCGWEPLALRAAGNAVADRPNWDIWLISEQARPTDKKSVSEQSGSGIFDAAYTLLTSDEQRALKVLGVLQERDFAPWVIAAALETTEVRADRLASRLADASLIERYNPGSGIPLYRAEESILRYAHLRGTAEENQTEMRRWDQLFRTEQRRRLTGPDGVVDSLDALLKHYDSFTSAVEGVRIALSLARERDSSTGEGSACAALAELYTDLGDIVAAEDVAQRAIGVDDDRSRARAYRCLSRLERRRHRLALAVSYADAAMDSALLADDPGEQVRGLLEKAVAMALRDKSAEADEICAEALSICETTNETAGSLHVAVKWCQGRVWFHARRYDEAAVVLADGWRIADDLGEKRLAAWIDHTRASVAMATGNWPAAEQHANAGIDAFTALRHRYGVAHCQHRLGQIRLEGGRVGEAIRILRESLESFHDCGDAWIEREVALDLAEAYWRNSQIGASLQMQRVAQRAYLRSGDPAQASHVVMLLFRTLLTDVVSRRSPDLKDTRTERV